MNRHVFWSAADAGFAAVFSILASFTIARLIGPSELGVAATAVSVHVALWVAVTALFADALVRASHVDTIIIGSARRASAVIGVGAMLVQAAVGALLGWAISDSRLVGMGLLLAAPLPFVGLAGPRQGLLTRERAYRRLALRTLFGNGAGAVLGIGLALKGAGAWALVAQQTATSLIGAGVLLIGWHPRDAWSAPAVRALLSTGLPLTASTITQIARYRLFAVLIGLTAGPATLGQVHMAFRLVDTVRELASTALWRLMLPILSEQQADPPAMLAAVDRLLRRSAVVTLPLCVGLAVALPWMVRLVLGPSWGTAAHAAEPLVALMLLTMLMFPAGVALVATGGVRPVLYANLAGLLVTACGVMLVRPTTATGAVLIWCLGQAFITPYVLWVSGRALGVGPLRPLRARLGAACGCATAASAVVAISW